MSPLFDYVLRNTKRGACQCGKCFDAPDNPEQHQPAGHTADLVFYQVSAGEKADAAELRHLVTAHKGEFGNVNPFDGKEHSYLELGGWIGDQGAALQLMGLGSLLGLWKLMTPKTLFGAACPDELAMDMAGSGYVTILAA